MNTIILAISIIANIEALYLIKKHLKFKKKIIKGPLSQWMLVSILSTWLLYIPLAIGMLVLYSAFFLWKATTVKIEYTDSVEERIKALKKNSTLDELMNK